MSDVSRSGVSRPRLLDLFCGAGGAAMGYHRAGFDVVGVDINPQPNYPFEFVQRDALDVLLDADLPFDAIHASPPCQAYTRARKLQGNEHPNLIGRVRQLLAMRGGPYVIENVEGARHELRDPELLCGVMFGLRLYRHRLFEMNWHYTAPLHAGHYLRQVKMGRKPAADEILQPVGHFSGVDAAREAMEMPWATQDGLREAVPPAYTEHIGSCLLAEVNVRQKAAA